MENRLSIEQRRQLDREGYVMLPGLLSQERVQALRHHLESLWREEGEQAGTENYIEKGARRLANLANKGNIFRPIYGHPLVLEAAALVMGADFHLSMLNARDVPPGSSNKMPFHVDTDHGARPDEKGYLVFTAVWMLDDFTRENGATRLVPRSHQTGLLPKEGMDDIFADHPAEIVAKGEAGDVLVFNGHCWHAGGQNRSSYARRALLAHYVRGDQPLADNRRQHLLPDLAAVLTPAERKLLALADGS